MSKTIGQAFLELALGGIPVPPPRVKINFDKIKINKIMEEKRKHPATVAEMALRNIKPDTPLHELMDVVKDALETYGYKDNPTEETQPSSEDFYKDGDFCVCISGNEELAIFIHKGEGTLRSSLPVIGIPYYAMLNRSNCFAFPFRLCLYVTYFPPVASTYRLAAPEEKQLLLDELAKSGYRWDEESKTVVKNCWKPKLREKYYIPWFSGTSTMSFSSTTSSWDDVRTDEIYYEKGLVFQTQEECDAFCQKLNEAIQNVKRE